MLSAAGRSQETTALYFALIDAVSSTKPGAAVADLSAAGWNAMTGPGSASGGGFPGVSSMTRLILGHRGVQGLAFDMSEAGRPAAQSPPPPPHPNRLGLERERPQGQILECCT